MPWFGAFARGERPWHSLSSAQGLSLHRWAFLPLVQSAAWTLMSLFRNCCSGCLVLALLLAGCGPSQPAKSPVDASPQATAPALPAPTPPAVSPSQQEMRDRNVQQLIDQVEKAYATGEAAYRK